tara:strand:+ start:1120 stop:1512 length:393 start_codon:yes stop_codon:yes gene_type:complete
MSKQVLSVLFKKKGKKLIITSDLSKEQYKMFLSSLKDDDVVEALFELRTMDNTKSQLAKIHVMLKIMADEQGYTAREMKNVIKEECSMYYVQQGHKVYTSFSQCDKDDLSNVIEIIIQKANFLNINLQGL